MKRDAHPQSLPFISFSVVSKGSLPLGSPNRSPIDRDAPFSEPPFNCLLELPVNGPPVILTKASVEKGAHLQSLLKAPVEEPPTIFPRGAPHGE